MQSGFPVRSSRNSIPEEDAFMKFPTALLVAVALVTPVFAQNAAVQDFLKKHKGAIAAPAVKPVLLYTGKPITEDDRKGLLADVRKVVREGVSSSAKAGLPNPIVGPTPVVNPFVPTSATITPQMMYMNGLVRAIAFNPAEVSPGDNLLRMVAPPEYPSSLVFYINANPNTAYTLIFQVANTLDASAPKFTLTSGWSTDNGPETFTGGSGDFQFAYIVTSMSQGYLWVTLESSNAEWDFQSCEISATPLSNP
jgi:hypothetical protein